MEDVFANYINRFKEIALPILEKNGFKLCYDGIKITHSSIEICLFKSPYFSTISFSTHHLDYADGVFIYKSKKRKYFGEMILPKGNIIQEGKEYQYSGKNLDEEILRKTTRNLKKSSSETKTL